VSVDTNELFNMPLVYTSEMVRVIEAAEALRDIVYPRLNEGVPETHYSGAVYILEDRLQQLPQTQP